MQPAYPQVVTASQGRVYAPILARMPDALVDWERVRALLAEYRQAWEDANPGGSFLKEMRKHGINKATLSPGRLSKHNPDLATIAAWLKATGHPELWRFFAEVEGPAKNVQGQQKSDTKPTAEVAHSPLSPASAHLLRVEADHASAVSVADLADLADLADALAQAFVDVSSRLAAAGDQLRARRVDRPLPDPARHQSAPLKKRLKSR